MKKLIIAILVSASLFSSQKSQSAQFVLDSYLGLSGTTSIFWALDEMLGTDGEFMQMAGDLGFITGEVGFSIKLESKNFGIAFETNFGYYFHFDTVVTYLSYNMFHFGIEPYMKLGKASIGLGMGYFLGFMFMDYDIYSYGYAAFHHGLSTWISAGWEFNDYFAMSARFRFHHFFQIGYFDLYDPANQSLANDFIFSLRFIFRLKLGGQSQF